ncbi:FAD-dependent monooxygenase [Citricoccus sp.]|uniref:FAD-dependent monooxygenase n=1 Tax=Micrococcaceae TaxID=1268 RepID=UPI002D1FA20D|nr:FAD-dependent monooxygenase [Citricoccus sp.]
MGVEATWATIPWQPADTDWWRWFNAPGGTVSLRPDRYGTMRTIITRTLPRTERREPTARRTTAEQRALLRRTFGGTGWEVDRVLDALEDVDDLYVEVIGQVHAPQWSRRRVVLLGDAAYCPSPVTGMGTTLAVVGAYVLAGEIASHADLAEGLAAYERTLRPWVEEKQKLPPGAPRIANPTSRAGVAALRTVMRAAGTPLGRTLASRLTRAASSAETFTLPDYPDLLSSATAAALSGSPPLVESMRRHALAEAGHHSPTPPSLADRCGPGCAWNGIYHVVMDMLAGWSDFHVAMVGATAALAGLVIVAASVNIDKVVATGSVTSRLAASIATLVVAIVVSGLGLVPGLPLPWFGAMTIAAAIPAVGFQFHAASTLARDRQGPTRGRSLRSAIGFVPILAYFAAGALCLAGQPSGVGVSAVGTLMTIIVALLISWIALVEVLR